MASTKIPAELSSTPGIVDNSNATAITIDSSENTTFAGNITSGALSVTSDTSSFIRNSTDNDLKFTFVTNNASDFAQLIMDGKDGGSEKFMIAYGSTHGSTPNMLALKSNDSSAGSIGFFTASTERARFDVNGRLGIGETAPDTFLHVKGTGSGGQGTVKLEGQSAHLGFTRADGNFRSWIGQYNSTTHGSDTDLNIKTGYVGGSSSTGNIRISADGDTTAAQLYVQGSTGNVGIGTTSPGHALDVVGTGKPAIEATCSAGHFAIEASTPYDYVAKFSSTDSGAAIVLQDNSSTNHANRINVSGNTMQFVTGATTAVTINASQNVGIGNTNPSDRLVVQKDTSNIEPILVLKNDNTTDDNGVSIDFSGKDTGGNNILYGRISSKYTNHATEKSHLIFEHRNDSGALSEGFRLTHDGNVGIGITNPSQLLNLKSNTPFIQFSQDGSDSYAGINFGDDDDANDGQILYDHDSRYMRFQVANAERMRINASGILLVGKTSGTAGNTIETNGRISAVAGSTGQPTFNCEGDTNTGINLPESDRIQLVTGGTEAIRIDSSQRVGTGGITSPAQNFVVGTTTNYDPPGLGNSNANFAILKKDASTAGNYGIITGVSSDGNVWSQVQRTDGSATSYNYYLQPSGGNVAIGVPQNHTYIPNLTVPLHVCKVRSGVGNVSDYLTHLAIEALGYAGSNYQLGCIDFNGGDTAGAHNPYARIGCSTMVGTNNQETGSLEFYVKAPNFGLSGTTHAMKITGKADTSSAGQGTTRNGVLFTYQGIAIDRSWGDYPCLNIMNATPYSSTASTQSELRIHGNNVSSASYPGTSGSDFSVVTRSDGGYATGSDRRRKKNITTIDNALSTVKQLTGKRFQTVNSVDEVQEHVSKNGYKFGFIAQEVEDIIPETVQYHADEDDGTDNYNTAYAMDYGSVVALLVNAIKEQDTTIQALEARIKALEDK